MFRGNQVAASVAFPWLFCGPLLSRKTVFEPFSWLFRGFSWLFRGFSVAPGLGKIYAYSPWNSLLRNGALRSFYGAKFETHPHPLSPENTLLRLWGV